MTGDGAVAFAERVLAVEFAAWPSPRAETALSRVSDRAAAYFGPPDDYDGGKGLTQVDGLNMFRALSAGRRASLYRTTRRIRKRL